MRKFFHVVMAIIAIVTLSAGSCGSNGPEDIPTIPWAQMPHGDKVRFAMVSFGGYPLQVLTVTDTGVTARIEGCDVEFSGNEQEADPSGQTPNPSAAVQSFAQFWALGIDGKKGASIPEPLRDSFWYDSHFVTNVNYSTLWEAITAAKTAGTLICN